MRNLLIMGVMVSAAALAGIPANANNPTPKSGNAAHPGWNTSEGVMRTPGSNGASIPECTEGRMDASMDRKTEILSEYFGNIPEGATETIGNKGDERYIDIIASRDNDPGRFLNESYTPQSGVWEGDEVFAGKGGTIILQCPHPSKRAILNTPLGDYSGDLTVTVRCRWAKTFWVGDSETGYVSTNGSELTIGVYTGGYDKANYAITDIEGRPEIETGQIYKNSGWQEITFKFHNESTNADGFLSFFTGESIEIDWIKVTDDNEFLGAPVINGASDFTEDGFSISWQPVRRAYSYFIDLYKMVFTADTGIDEMCDFESDDIPSWLNCEGAEAAAGEGLEDSRCMVISDDETYLSTVDKGINLDKFTAEVKFRMESEEHPITVVFEVKGEDGWQEYTSIECDGWWCAPEEYIYIDFKGQNFSGKYSAVRICTYGANENNKLFVDNISVYAERPYELKRVYDDELSFIGDLEDDDFIYNYYDITYDDHYTFRGLDPETEYWYRVRSQLVSEFGVGEKRHAFGVATPEALPATDVTEDAYTANWKDVAKAQKYLVINYGTHTVTEDTSNYAFISETFSKCEGNPNLSDMNPINNLTECYLDEYTDQKGWRGVNTYIGENMIGGGEETGSYLITPMMMVNPEKGAAYIYIHAVGTPGDMFILKGIESGKSSVISFGESGEINGAFELEASCGEQLKLYSYADYGFAVKVFKVMQAVKKGEIVRTFDQLVEVAPGTETVTFSGLTQSSNAYEVIANFTLETQTVNSRRGKVIYVGAHTGVETPVYRTGTEIARYSVNGYKVGKDHKGIVFIKLDTGEVKKVLIK